MNCNPLRQDSSRKHICFVFLPRDSKQTYGTRFLTKRMHMACRCLCTVTSQLSSGPIGVPKVYSDLPYPSCGVRRRVFEGTEEFFVSFFMGRRNLHPVLNIQSYSEGRSKQNLLRPMLLAASIQEPSKPALGVYGGRGDPDKQQHATNH